MQSTANHLTTQIAAIANRTPVCRTLLAASISTAHAWLYSPARVHPPPSSPTYLPSLGIPDDAPGLNDPPPLFSPSLLVLIAIFVAGVVILIVCPCLGGVFHAGIGFILSKQLSRLATATLGWFCCCGVAHVDGHRRLTTEEVKFVHPLCLEGMADTGRPMLSSSSIVHLLEGLLARRKRHIVWERQTRCGGQQVWGNGSPSHCQCCWWR